MPRITKDRSKALRGLRKTTKRVTAQINDTKGLGDSFGRKGQSIGDAGDDLAHFSGIESSKRSKRPRDDPFNQIGL